MATNRTKKKAKEKQAILIIVGLCLFLGALVSFQIFLEDENQYDESTLCPVNGANDRTVIILDKSDKWDNDDAVRVNDLIAAINKDVSKQSRLTIISISGEGRKSTDVTTEFDKCNPGTEQQCTALYENCRRIRKRYDDSFQARLDEVIVKLREPGEASFTPLFETVVQAVDDNQNQSLEVHVISDFMENGSKFRFYDTVPLFEELITEYPIQSKANITVFGHVAERRRHSRQLIEAVENVWTEYFQEQGIQARFSRLLITD